MGAVCPARAHLRGVHEGPADARPDPGQALLCRAPEGVEGVGGALHGAVQRAAVREDARLVGRHVRAQRQADAREAAHHLQAKLVSASDATQCIC